MLVPLASALIFLGGFGAMRMCSLAGLLWVIASIATAGPQHFPITPF